MDGTVFSIEECSVYDGPGIRTTVFLKGCPLRCSWCHNPEGQDAAAKIVKSPNGCLRCGLCDQFADDRGYTEDSIQNCPRQLLRWCGQRYSPEELCEKLLKNKRLLDGITFSGGEPLYQYGFLLECLQLLKGQLHRAVQTSGFAAETVFSQMLQHTDYVLFDLKIMDEDAHKYHTGQSNAPILRNFEQLIKSGVEFVPRTPLIPGVTDTVENLTAIAQLLQSYGLNYMELLPYNPMAGSKYALAGKKFQPTYDPSQTPQTHEEVFDAYGIKVKVY